jgi:CTP synthase (UTP-ammonia lyase)
VKPPAVILLGEYDAAFPPHVATEAAAYTSATAVGGEVSARWLSTAEVSDRSLREASGLWVTPGSPYRDLRRTLNAIRYAREHSLPCLGTCGGFQHIVLEYARNVLGYVDAAHAEYDPYASSLFVSQLACSLAGRTMRLTFRRDSRVAAWYGSLTAEEQYYCNFGVNPERASVLASGALEIVGHDSEGEVRVVELPDHEFFVGTLYVPQMRSTPARPHPLISAFIRAVIRRQSEAA